MTKNHKQQFETKRRDKRLASHAKWLMLMAKELEVAVKRLRKMDTAGICLDLENGDLGGDHACLKTNEPIVIKQFGLEPVADEDDD